MTNEYTGHLITALGKLLDLNLWKIKETSKSLLHVIYTNH